MGHVPFGLPVVGVRGCALVIGKHVLLVLPYGVQSGALVAGGVKLCAVVAQYVRGIIIKKPMQNSSVSSRFLR